MTVSWKSIGATALSLMLVFAAARQAKADESMQSGNAVLRADGSDGNWADYGGGYGESHYSPLGGINAGNASRLGLAWWIDLPTRNSDGAPLEVDGVVYFATGLSIVSAADARTGKVLWTYDPKAAAVAGEKLREAWGIRGIAWWNGKVITGTQDGRLIALNAADGHPVWSVQTTLPHDGRYITGAPAVFNGKVIIGNGGSDFAPGGRGYVTAYDAENGKKLWRFYLVPGKPGHKDGAASDSIMERAAQTWTGDWWKYGGGGNAWNAITYDPELNRIYIGTGNAEPWNRAIRSPGGGSNWFTCSIVAVDADTGRYLWHYQTTPGDQWDLDSTQDIELARLLIDGKPRDVILHAPKNGFFYVIDRRTGKLISAKPIVKVTWASGIDEATGMPIVNPQARLPNGRSIVWPGGTGGHNWMPMSFSPETGLVYIPTTEAPGLFDDVGINRKSWHYAKDVQLATGYAPFVVRGSPPPMSSGPASALLAWDPIAQKARWSVPLPGLYNGGVLSTAGNLVFQGNAQGKFVAYAADSGKPLWSFDAQDGILGQPITYRADGRQYVLVMTGFGGIAGSTGPAEHAFGWQYQYQKRRLLAFTLGGAGKLPSAERVALHYIDDPSLKLNAATVDRGAVRYAEQCVPCHGVGVVAAGSAPDLRASQAVLSTDALRRILQHGALLQGGMPNFAQLSNGDVEALRQYIIARARAPDNK